MSKTTAFLFVMNLLSAGMNVVMGSWIAAVSLSVAFLLILTASLDAALEDAP